MELKEIKEEMDKILSQSNDPQIAILRPLLLLLFEMIEDLNKQTAELTLTLQQRQQALKDLNKQTSKLTLTLQQKQETLKDLNKSPKKTENTKVNLKKPKTTKTRKKVSSSSKKQEDQQ